MFSEEEIKIASKVIEEMAKKNYYVSYTDDHFRLHRPENRGYGGSYYVETLIKMELPELIKEN